MKYSIRRFIVCVALVAGCLWPFATRPEASPLHNQSGIGGRVQGFIQSHQWNVQVVSSAGKNVADFLTAADGSFQVNLQPGAYVLKAYIRNVGPHPVLWGTPVEVTVRENEFATVFLTITAPPFRRAI